MKIVENKTTDYTAANFTEDETAWLVGSTFNFEDEIRDGHYIYKYASPTPNSNTTDSPSVDSVSVAPSWVLIRPSNYYAMLDGKTNTQTENLGSIVIDVASINYDSLALIDIIAASVDISLYDNTGMAIVYTNTFEIIDTSKIIDYYTYAFEPIESKTSLYDDQIPLYSNATLTITMTVDPAAYAKCGRLVFGSSYQVGQTGYGANLSQESYSRKETDIFGNVNLVPIGSVNYDSYEVLIPTSKIPALRQKFRSLDAVAVLFVMDESPTSTVENLLNFGYWDRFNIILTSPVNSTISTTIKGLL